LVFEKSVLDRRAHDPPEVESIVQPLARMAAMSRAVGARFAVLCLPALPETGIEPREPACHWAQLVRWAHEAGVPVLSVAPLYARSPMRALRLDHIHLTAFGHRVLAVAWVRWLLDERLVPWRAVRRPPDFPAIPVS
jgi:hypothetical protein